MDFNKGLDKIPEKCVKICKIDILVERHKI